MTDLELQIKAAMSRRGLTPPDSIHVDGNLHRFRSGTKEHDHDKTGWYVFFSGGIPAGKFGCWRARVEQTFRATLNRELTPEERDEWRRQLEQIRAMREAAKVAAQQSTASVVNAIWETASPADPNHPYLRRKGIQPNGARETGDNRLIVPLYNQAGDLSTLQYIEESGSKVYHLSGGTAGCFWILGDLTDSDTVYLAEGFATSATIHEATGKPVVVAYSASNLVPVCEILSGWIPGSKVVIVADHDKSGIGQRYAEQASAKFGARYVMPPEVGDDANDFAVRGGDLLALLEPVKSDWLVSAATFLTQPSPIKWLIRNWIPQNCFAMVWGKSGGGKTFAVLDWCMRIATGLPEWCENKITCGPVVYLAGEGHHGIRARVAAWVARHGVVPSELYVSSSGCDLDTAEGYLKARDAIVALDIKPVMIVVDTLHRHLSGDENSSQDAKLMISACAHLMKEFGSTVLLVHHTGASEEAKFRMRGSSAWKGALDVEISVTPEESEIIVSCCKMKDAEAPHDISGKLDPQEIPEWFDDEGAPISNIVFVAEKRVEPVKIEEKKDTDHTRHWRDFERSWWDSGTELDEFGMPIVSRSAMRSFLRKQGLSEAQIGNNIRADRNGLIGVLIRCETIATTENGWRVIDQARGMLLAQRAAGNA